MSDSYALKRSRMIAMQLAMRGIHDNRVLEAMRDLPRHLFVPPEMQQYAYTDQPLNIGDGQTISQPYIVALMTQMLHLTGSETVLEIGTGSGYQTAILCQLAKHVYTLEYHPRLAGRAARILSHLGFNNVDIHVGDGSQGLPDMAPFDAVLVTAAAPALPGPLRSQLSEDGGRLVIPVGSRDDQHLERVTRHGDTWDIEQTERVRFVPLLGRYGFQRSSSAHRSDSENDTADV
jgi:protein-L-isoaspartate(D-aspartate) O-methyltransferase